MVTMTQMTMMKTVESRVAMASILHSCCFILATILRSRVLFSYRYANWYWGGDSLHLRYHQEGGRAHTLEVAAETDIVRLAYSVPGCLPWA